MKTKDQQGMLPTAASVAAFNVSFCLAEVSVVLGRVGHTINPENNSPDNGHVVDWFQALSISPIIAKQLYLSLAQAISFYEKKYGPILEDPEFGLVPLSDDKPEANTPR